MYHLTVNFYGHETKTIDTENLVLLKDYIKLYRSVENSTTIAVDETTEECSIPSNVYTTYRGIRGWSNTHSRLPITMRGTKVQE